MEAIRSCALQAPPSLERGEAWKNLKVSFRSRITGITGMRVAASSSTIQETSRRYRFLNDQSGPNKLVLEAQGRVCTGQTQTRPLSEDQAFKVLQTIAQSARGELPEKERVSSAQLGAFFAAMTIRSSSFPAPTRWSEGERKCMLHFWPELVQHLPSDVLFLADPDGSLVDEGVSHRGSTFVGRGPSEMRLVGGLREVLRGAHLGFEEVVGILRDILPLRGDSETSDALVAAFLIALRMNGETDRELKAFCMAFDDELGDLPVANVKSLTHYGEPYDGNTRFFRSTLFVAAVRASYGECCLLHGVDKMPPKWGVTEEQILRELGAATNLSPASAARILEDENVGFAYISQREARKSWYSLVEIREHIKKRPTLATTEKVQRYVKGTGRESMLTGFYHQGYEDSLLMLMRRRGVDAGLIIKGEEGALSLTTKSPSPDTVVKGHPVNFCSGFRPSLAANSMDGILRETFSLTMNAAGFGFTSTPTPRIERPTQVRDNIEHGLGALKGVKGAAYDRIVFNAAMVDNLLGCCEDPLASIERAKAAIDSGKALKHLNNYVQATKL